MSADADTYYDSTGWPLFDYLQIQSFDAAFGGTHPEDVLLVGDTNHDHDVAQSLGIGCVLITGGHQSEPRLTAPDTINHLNELLHHKGVKTA